MYYIYIYTHVYYVYGYVSVCLPLPRGGGGAGAALDGRALSCEPGDHGSAAQRVGGGDTSPET